MDQCSRRFRFVERLDLWALSEPVDERMIGASTLINAWNRVGVSCRMTPGVRA